MLLFAVLGYLVLCDVVGRPSVAKPEYVVPHGIYTYAMWVCMCNVVLYKEQDPPLMHCTALLVDVCLFVLCGVMLCCAEHGFCCSETTVSPDPV